MKNSEPLSERSKKDLTELARRRGIRGCDTMNKDELVKVLSRTSPAKAKPAAKTSRLSVKSTPKSEGAKTEKSSGKIASPPMSKANVKPATKVAKSSKATSSDAGPDNGAPSAPSTAGANGTHRTSANGTGHSASGRTVSVEAAASATSSTKAVKAEAQKPAIAKPAGNSGTSGRDVSKDIQAQKPLSGPSKDRIIMAVHDPYWLHVYWELSAASVQRAEAALKQDWYGAKLILRLYDVTSQDTTSTFETPIRDIPIETDGNNWYINVQQPPRQYRADLGYISRRGMLFVLARSNVVTPPKAGSSEAIDAGWNMDTKKAERILAMSSGFESAGNPELREVFEERLKRSLGTPKETGFGTGATPPGSLKKFFFEIDARLIVHGRTDPSAHLTLGNDPIKLSPDGTFMMSFSLPDSRQIIPAVATSADGVEERTIVLAVERNTKYLDPMIHDQMNEL